MTKSNLTLICKNREEEIGLKRFWPRLPDKKNINLQILTRFSKAFIINLLVNCN